MMLNHKLDGLFEDASASANTPENNQGNDAELIRKVIQTALSSSKDLAKKLFQYVLMTVKNEEPSADVEVDGTQYKIVFTDDVGDGKSYVNVDKNYNTIKVNFKPFVLRYIDSSKFKVTNKGGLVNKKAAFDNFNEAVNKALPLLCKNIADTATPSGNTEHSDDKQTEPDIPQESEIQDQSGNVDTDDVIADLIAVYKKKFEPRVESDVEQNPEFTQEDINQLAAEYTDRIIGKYSDEVPDDAREQVERYIIADITKKIRIRNKESGNNQDDDPNSNNQFLDGNESEDREKEPKKQESDKDKDTSEKKDSDDKKHPLKDYIDRQLNTAKEINNTFGW